MHTPNVTAIDLPPTSALHERIQTSDFIDCYQTTAEISPRKAAQTIVDFPGWAKGLLHIRKLITTPFGLRQNGPAAPDKLGPFPVESETPTEIIAGFNDKHLDFRVSVIAQDGKVSLATWVHTHNIGGRVYLALILPFHIAIAKNALLRVTQIT